MRILPENLEERKWVKRIALLSFLVLLLIGFSFNFFPILILNRFLYYIFIFVIYGTFFLIFGFFIGLLFNIDKRRIFYLCFNGTLILEVIPIFFGLMSLVFFGMGFFIGMIFFIGLAILFGAITCGLGGFMGAKIREKIWKGGK